jgi:hypothetical protein
LEILNKSLHASNRKQLPNYVSVEDMNYNLYSYKMNWRRGDALDTFSGDIRLQSQSRYQLSQGYFLDEVKTPSKVISNSSSMYSPTILRYMVQHSSKLLLALISTDIAIRNVGTYSVL